MRALVLSDIHSNMEGLQAVLADAKARGGFDAVWCTGDLVGYGPEPGETLALLRSLGAVCVCGNHDLAACGAMGVEEFNPVAATAALWTRDNMSGSDRDDVAALPKIRVEEGVSLVHGSLRAPEWEYLLDHEAARAQFELQATPLSIVGHSHLQFICVEDERGTPHFRFVEDGEQHELDGVRAILNAGSSGQPRDGNPRAGYMLFDTTTSTVSWHRVAYDAEATRSKIIAAGLPRVLGDRLLRGQ